MKRLAITLVLWTLIGLGSVTAARADVSVRFSSGHRHDSRVRYYYGPPAYNPYRHTYPRYYAHRPYRPVVVHPVVVSQPYYVAAPVVTAPPVSNSSYTGDYGQDISSFRERLSRLYAVLEKQKDKQVLPKEIYERLTSTLDGIDHDQKVRAFDRGGNLNASDFAELDRRLDQAAADIEVALAS